MHVLHVACLLSCINEYLAIDNGLIHMYESNSLRAVIVTWLNISRGSRVGVGMHISTRR